MTCPHCKFEITKEALAVLKFAKDIVKPPDTNPSSYLAYVASLVISFYTEAHFITSGTLHTPTHDLDIARGNAVKAMILQSVHFKSPKDATASSWERNIQQMVKHSMSCVETAAGLKMKAGGGRL
jgi:hypothetical protein